MARYNRFFDIWFNWREYDITFIFWFSLGNSSNSSRVVAFVYFSVYIQVCFVFWFWFNLCLSCIHLISITWLNSIFRLTVVTRLWKSVCLKKYDLGLFQALERLWFSETVAWRDVDEALHLMQMSKYSLYSDDRQRSGLDAIADIYSRLRDEAARTSNMDVKFGLSLNLISRKL